MGVQFAVMSLFTVEPVIADGGKVSGLSTMSG